MRPLPVRPSVPGVINTPTSVRRNPRVLSTSVDSSSSEVLKPVQPVQETQVQEPIAEVAKVPVEPQPRRTAMSRYEKAGLTINWMKK